MTRQTSAKTKKRKPPATPSEYLAGLPSHQRAALQKLRRAIKAAAPQLEECIAYGLPSFRWNGKYLFSYGVAGGHCAFYPGSLVQKLGSDLKQYSVAKGTIHFSPEKPLPERLVRKLVKLRMEQRRS